MVTTYSYCLTGPVWFVRHLVQHLGCLGAREVPPDIDAALIVQRLDLRHLDHALFDLHQPIEPAVLAAMDSGRHAFDLGPGAVCAAAQSRLRRRLLARYPLLVLLTTPFVKLRAGVSHPLSQVTQDRNELGTTGFFLR